MNVSKSVAIATILFAFVIGFGAAYIRNSVELVTASGLLYSKSQKEDGFTQTFEKLAHLGTIEYAAANCSGRSDVQVALINESKMLALLGENNEPADREPLPLAAAQARLAIREMMEMEKRSGTSANPGLAEHARSFAASAGWKDSSDAHLRQVVDALDRDTCALPGGGANSQ